MYFTQTEPDQKTVRQDEYAERHMENATANVRFRCRMHRPQEVIWDEVDVDDFARHLYSKLLFYSRGMP